jgi:hypothetical protein
VKAENITEEALQSAKPILERCKGNTASLKKIFDDIIPAKDASRAERLKKVVGMKMKSSKAKEYMEEIIKGMELLAQNQVFQDAEALKDIKEAIKQLSNIPNDSAANRPIPSHLTLGWYDYVIMALQMGWLISAGIRLSSLGHFMI